jgi:hypothetical protein
MANREALEILDKALKRRADLRVEIEALDHLIRTYRALLQLPDDDERSDLQPDLYQNPTTRALQQARITQAVDAARRIIISEKRPMKRGELVRRLEAQGIEMVGSDKNKVFGTNLWRSGKFRAIEGRGYWPVDVELPRESRQR